MTIKKFSKRAIVTSLFLGVVLASTVALASWLATGTGNGYAKAGTAQPLTTNVATVTSGSLYPGGNGDVYITVNNPNPYPVTVTGVTGTTAIVTTDNNATCDGATGVTFTNQSRLDLHGGGEQHRQHDVHRRRPHEQRFGQHLPGRDLRDPGLDHRPERLIENPTSSQGVGGQPTPCA